MMVNEVNRVPRGTLMEARITVEGTEADGESLWDWLKHEPELRGRLRVAGVRPPEGVMGASIELVVVLVTAGTTVASTLARSLSTWLTQRRSDLTVKVAGPDGREISVSSRRVADPEKLLRAVLESAEPERTDELPPAGGSGAQGEQ
jgi:Effector Associated Constant Component 1